MSCEVKRYHSANHSWKLYIELSGIPYDLTELSDVIISVYIKGDLNEYYQNNLTSAGAPDHGVTVEGANIISIRFGWHYDSDLDSIQVGVWEPDNYYLEIRILTDSTADAELFVLTTECFQVYEEVECV